MYILNALGVFIAWTLPASYLAFLMANENEFLKRHEKGFSVFLTVVSWFIGIALIVFLAFIFTASPSKWERYLIIPLATLDKQNPNFFGYMTMLFLSALVAIDTMKDVALYRKFVNSGDETTTDFNFFTRRVMALYYWFLTFTRFIYDAIFNLFRFRKIVFPTHGVKKEPEIVQAKESKESPPQEEKPRSAKSEATQNILDKLDKF